jgi:group II intron reverse transcriptase/maturase
MGDTSRSQTISTKLQRIAKQAADNPQTVFNTLAHLIDVEMLHEAYRRTNKKGAAGIDKVTAELYAEDLEGNIADLYERLKAGRYKAPPVFRVWLEKEGGKRRPIGKPTFEDKIVQRSVVMLLEPIYEQVFLYFSYGFRKGRSQHQALASLREGLIQNRVGWIISADIEGLFDNIDHVVLRRLLKLKIKDGSLLRLIGKWLNAGVMEDGAVHHPEAGTPQGGVISPMLSNIFLHYVLDEWFAKEVRPRLKGRSFIIRWADDFIIGCELKSDADRIMSVLPKRFNRYELNLHPEKTKLVRYMKPYSPEESRKTGTFDFLGFTFYWGKSRKGYWVIKKRTARKRLSRFLTGLWQWCKSHRHESIQRQHKILCSKLRGFYQYFGVRCNYKALEAAHEYARKAWRRWLSRRSSKGKVTFEDLNKTFPLPLPRIVHQV